MFENKKIIGIVIAVVVVVAVAAFLVLGETSESENNNPEENGEAQEEVEESAVEFSGSYLYQAGEDGEQSFRDASTEMSEFNVGDFLAISGSYTAEDSAVIQFHVLDENGEIVQQNAMEFRANEGENNSLDACCEEVPSTQGSYSIGADVDGERVDFSLPFEVVETEEEN